MAKRSKQKAGDSFPFTVPIIGPEPRDRDAREFIAALSEAEPSGGRPRDAAAADRGPSADAVHRARQRTDQIVTAGAAAALVLSITFLRDIAPSPSAGARWVLLAGWAALLVALGSALVHHHVDRDAPPGTSGSRAGARAPAGAASRPIAWLAVIASAGLVAGLACLAVFAFLDLDVA